MPDWLSADLASSTPVAVSDLLVRLGGSVVCGCAVAAIYRLSHGRSKPDRGVLTTTLVLLSILIALVSLVIGDSVARAFSLVGALSIVRFRTVVEDTRDTAFVIFAVIAGMGTGTGLFAVPLIGIPIVGVVAIALSFASASRSSVGSFKTSALDVRIGLGRDPDATLAPVFARLSVERRLVSIATARQGAAIDVSYRIALKSAEDASSLVASLNQVEGVQSVGLRLADSENDSVPSR